MICLTWENHPQIIADSGFEPPLLAKETSMLPLHQSAALKRANQSSPNLRLD